MRGLRSTMALLVVLLGLGAYIYFVTWKQPEGGELCSFTIITTEANDLLRPIHDRMPVILDRACEDRWLDQGLTESKLLTPLLQPFPPDLLEAYEVSPIINSPANDRPECIEPAR